MNTPLPPAKALAIVMHDVARLVRRRADKAAQSVGLTSAQWRVLAHLARAEGSNQACIADHMDMEPITLSRHLDRMQAAGMIERRPDPKDRRAHRLFLTETGRGLMEGFRTATTDVMDDLVEGLSEGEIAATIDVLTRMRSNLTGKSVEASSTAPTLSEKVFAQ
jgi:MarR family transcriptional regulator for hemolysin